MPKSKKRNNKGGGGRQHQAVQPFSDEDASIETMSRCSSFSDSTSLADEVVDDVDEEASQEDYEYKLRGLIDSTLDKSAKVRLSALEGLKSAFSSKILYDFILERRVTLTDSIERCLKKGKSEEQCIAAHVASLLCIQLGSSIESEEVFKSLRPIFKTILFDESVSVQTRRACATSLAVCCYVAADDIEDLHLTMTYLETVFTTSYQKEDQTDCFHSTQTTTLGISTLVAWTLLLTICPPSLMKKIFQTHLTKLPSLLSCGDVNMRIAAGETMALLFELARDMCDDFEYEDMELLCGKLKSLATDGNKYRAKTDRKKQRSVFRDVLKTVEEGDFDPETITFGPECMYIDSWVKKRTYETFKELLASGVRFHLQANEFVRSVFELGPPLLLDAATLKAAKTSRIERHFYNAAVCKARTKARNKFRDKRLDIGEYV
ncbi:interferon-related developmental regulator 1 isoform X1 [Carcharodon carcharias]|uniref:interferon-related developmental regulator 1 isoform X1 n=2 Tax=Carcharodon carcharias TaxID=13397 RepID=UPI001B7F65D3|nr:interferon-related developmental regulator 1 isoform X1 [Carcharodon carcharias]